MWPLISPASGAPTSFIFALIERMAGLPHQRLAAGGRGSAGARCCVHLTSNRIGRARVALQHVAREQHQLAVGIDDLAVLGDDAEPVAVAVEREAELGVAGCDRGDQVGEVLRLARVGMVIAGSRRRPREYSSITLQPSARRIAGAEAPAMPLPESTAIFIGRFRRQSPTMRARVLGEDVHRRLAAAALGVVLGLHAPAQAPGSPRRRSPGRRAPS